MSELKTAWLEREFTRQRGPMGLADWSVKVVADAERAMDGETGPGAPDGTLVALYSYKEATLYYNPERLTEENAEHMVRHELAHLLVEPMRALLEELINEGRLPAAARRAYGRWAEQALELTVTAVEKAVAPQDRPSGVQ